MARLAFHLNNVSHSHVEQTLTSDLTFLRRMHKVFFADYEIKLKKWKKDRDAWKYVTLMKILPFRYAAFIPTCMNGIWL
jgi:hypothetical protein